ncbi:MAG: hypothetical protein WD830_11945 [Chloroflexota bacterium]
MLVLAVGACAPEARVDPNASGTATAVETGAAPTGRPRPSPSDAGNRPDPAGEDLTANLLEKEKDGEWTRGEGLVATLRLLTGEARAADVLRVPDMQPSEATGIVALAREYVRAHADDAAARAEIERLLSFLVFSDEQLTAMSRPSTTAFDARDLADGALTAELLGTGPEDCTKFFGGYKIAPVSSCLEVRVLTIAGKPYRIFRPARPLPTAGWTEQHVDLLEQGVREAVPVLSSLGKVPAANLVFHVQANAQALMSATPVPGKPCGISIYPSAQKRTGADFRQVVAHELAHCFQTETFPAQNFDYGVTRWREEGLADHLSDLVYPSNNLEWKFLPTLKAQELSTSLLDRAYTNFLWFQYLANRLGRGRLLELIGSLPTSGGRTEQADAMAAWPDVEALYHDFVRRYTDGTIRDTSGAFIPTVPASITVAFGDAFKPLIDEPVLPFAVLRYALSPDEGKRAVVATSGADRTVAARSPSAKDWRDLPATMPESCESTGPLIVIATNTRHPFVGQFRVDVTSIEDSDCPTPEPAPAVPATGTVWRGHFTERRELFAAGSNVWEVAEADVTLTLDPPSVGDGTLYYNPTGGTFTYSVSGTVIGLFGCTHTLSPVEFPITPDMETIWGGLRIDTSTNPPTFGGILHLSPGFVEVMGTCPATSVFQSGPYSIRASGHYTLGDSEEARPVVGDRISGTYLDGRSEITFDISRVE